MVPACLLVVALSACLPPPSPPPIVGNPPPGPPAPKVSVFGDSVSWSLVATGAPDAATVSQLGLGSMANRSEWFCELFPLPRLQDGYVYQASTNCSNWREKWKSAVAYDKPDIAVLHIGAWEIFPRYFFGWAYWGSPGMDTAFNGVLDEAIRAIGSTGAKVAIMIQPPFNRGPSGPPEWTMGQRWRVDHLNDLLRAAAARNRAYTIELATLECPPPSGQCQNDNFLRDASSPTGGVHFSPAGSRWIMANWVAPRLRAIATS